MFSLPNTPINTVALVGAVGVLGVTAFVVKKKSEDTQHFVDTTLETKKMDAEMQATMLATIKEMTTKTLV